MSKIKLKTCQFCGEQINKKELSEHVQQYHVLEQDDYDDRLEAKRKEKSSTLLVKKQKAQQSDSHSF